MSKCESASNAARDLYATATARRNYPAAVARMAYPTTVARRAFRPGELVNLRGAKKMKPKRFDGRVH